MPKSKTATGREAFTATEEKLSLNKNSFEE